MKIEIRELTKRYGGGSGALEVLSKVDYSFPEKGMVGIIGRSGVGKSTLLQLLGGLDTPTSGDVYYDDKRLSRMADDELSAFRGTRIGFVFQFHHLLPEFTAQENVAMPLIIQGCGDDRALEEAASVLERVELGGRLLHTPGMLSGGEQQRVAIARAIAGKPAVVLLDEPTGNLDLESGKMVQRLLRELQAELGNLMVAVTHSVELASEMDVVLEMQPGGHLTPKDKRGFS